MKKLQSKTTKHTIKSDKEAMREIQNAYQNEYIRPSSQVMDQFKKYFFSQRDLEYLIIYGKRNNKYDYPTRLGWVYGVSVIDIDHRSFYGQFDIKNKTLVTMEKIDLTT